ncbi:hypothetical protein [Nocardiopsis kunsanensis]|uniref:Lipoprotein n=1 Tax=Nocardiopsis kunsanensis TaxID=141693 RepID=A0A918X8C7_9ACTN|nr:hypothetical protein [Nocardiopsis kunsanensis]GHD16743.1 hypothetical protein GCM10007147_05170 [Nocardiopsis kunsanensis]
MFSARVSTAAAALALLAGPGCAAPGADAEQSGRDAASGAASPTLVRDYVTALAAASDPDRMREGLDLAEDGSTAHDYLRHYATLFQAWQDEGAPVRDSDVRSTPETHELCRTEEPAGEPSCVVYEDFTEDDERLVDLRVNGVDPGPRMSSADGGTDDSEGVRATFLSAYRTIDDNTLVVTADLTTVDEAGLDLDGATYVPDGSGDGRPASLAAGRHQLDAGSGTLAAFYFPRAEPGGELHLEGCLTDCSSTVELKLPVPD